MRWHCAIEPYLPADRFQRRHSFFIFLCQPTQFVFNYFFYFYTTISNSINTKNLFIYALLQSTCKNEYQTTTN